MTPSYSKNAPLVVLIIVTVLLGISFFLITETSPNIGDSIGYVYAGERLAIGQGLTYDDPNNQLTNPYFSLFAFQIQKSNDDRMFLGYPPGLPLLLAGSLILTGQTVAIHYVIPMLAVVGVLATFYLGYLVIGNSWGGLWAALILVTAPTYWQFSTAVWLEVPSITTARNTRLLY